MTSFVVLSKAKNLVQYGGGCEMDKIILGLLPTEWVKMREKSLRALNIREF